ncbi:MAG: hypothetical protein IIA30_15005 [Myxococcales bacterium]|nr:hypothetical protein [Myxococcales bacterium]
MDVDKSTVPIEVACERLRMMGVDLVAHTTHSHGKKPGENSYRIFVDYLADGVSRQKKLDRLDR